MKIIQVNNVTMTFTMSKERIMHLKEYFIKKVKNEIEIETFNALTDVSFSVEKGEMFGILGLNGSGKSTLLKIVAGVFAPTSGSVGVYGNVAPLIELGAGFDMELTARENIYLNALILGKDKKYIDTHFNEIVEFAEIGEFLDVPMKNYSSGMVARVGFAVATATVPDILIADEILAVGDYKFQKKCEDRINEMIESGTTVLFVSHAIKQVRELCHRCIWIEQGRVKMIGETEEVCREYQSTV